jgi:hypothetical protein
LNNSNNASSSTASPLTPTTFNADVPLSPPLTPVVDPRLKRRMERAIFGVPIPLLLARQKQIPALSTLDVPFVVFHIVEHIRATNGL